MATKPNTDHHIVIAALSGLTDKAYIGATAVTAPMTYDEALKVWTDLDNRRTEHSRKRGSHVLHYAVRSAVDPRYAPLIGLGYADARGRDGYPSQYGDSGRVKAAKAWAKLYGYFGAGGGWIYGPGGKVHCQGWDSLAIELVRQQRISRGADGLWYVLDREMVK